MAPSDAWKQQPDGSWLQGYDGIENYFYAVSAPEGHATPFMIGSRVKFSFNGGEKDIMPSLQRAWVEMRLKQPTLAAIATEKGKLYKTADTSEVESWLKSSFKVHTHGEDPESYFEQFLQVPYMILHYFPSSNELLLQACHILIDGIGVLYFWNEFFSTLESSQQPTDHSQFGSEYARLPPTVTELLSLPDESPPSGQQRATELVTKWAEKAYAKDAAGVPVRDATSAPANHCFRREIKLSSGTTRAIIETCKKNGYTVTCAWQAAVILAMQQHKSINGLDPKSATAAIPMNLRNYFPETFDARRDFAAPYYITMLFQVDYDGDGSSFENLAKFKSSYFRTTLAPDSGDFEMLPAYIDMSVGGAKADAPPPSSAPVLSSMGLVDRYLGTKHGRWTVDDFWIADTTTLPMCVVFLWTFNGQMVLSLSPNAAYMTREMADGFLKQVQHILLDNLGLK
ncbi:hypothetical protein SCUP234_01756 [Seiridium cupressi]